MVIEGFLSKVAFSIIKCAASKTIIAPAIKGFEVYSTIHSAYDAYNHLDSLNDSRKLMVKGVQVASDQLTDYAINKLLDIGSHTFNVEQTASGLYIVSKVAPRFKIDEAALQQILQKKLLK